MASTWPPLQRELLQSKFVSWTQSASVVWYTTAPQDCHSTFSVCNSLRLHINSLSPCPPTPIAIAVLCGPLFSVGSPPNETVSHRLQCRKYPPPYGYSGDPVNLWPGQFHCCLPFLGQTNFLGNDLSQQRKPLFFSQMHITSCIAKKKFQRKSEQERWRLCLFGNICLHIGGVGQPNSR